MTRLLISPYIAYIRANWKREEGQTMAEYGVVLALITLAVVTVIGALGTQVHDKIQQVVDALTPA